MPSSVAANGERVRAMREGLRIYNLFPTLAGPIAGWTAELPRIAAMAFNAVYVNPFHYPGFCGSLYAVKDYYRLNPRFRGKARARLDETEALAAAGFAYLFNSVKWWDFESPWLLDQYDRFRHIAPTIGFPESHDTERLVTELVAAGFPDSEIEAHYRQAYAFAAAFSTGVMMPMGFEYGWARRISVVPQDSEAPESPRFDLSAFIAGVNRLKASVPALNEEGPQRLLSRPNDPVVTLLRQNETGVERALTLINTQDHDAHDVVAEELLAGAGLGYLGARLLLEEVRPGGEPQPAPARLRVMPLEVKVLHAALRPFRQVAIGPCDAGRKPAHHPAWRPDARVVIENVYPEIDGGRYPAKRIVGDAVEVWADLFRDGHDKLRAVLHYAFEDEAWHETPFAFHDNDRWVARFRPDRVGRWRYTIEAWPDRFESWREDLVKKRGAGQAVDLELAEGVSLVEAAVAQASKADAARRGKLLKELTGRDAERRAETLR